MLKKNDKFCTKQDEWKPKNSGEDEFVPRYS